MTTPLPPTNEDEPRWALGFFAAGLIGAALILLAVPGWRWIGGLILALFFFSIAWRMQQGYSISLFFRRDSWRR
jgi:hypothetical protein